MPEGWRLLLAWQSALRRPEGELSLDWGGCLQGCPWAWAAAGGRSPGARVPPQGPTEARSALLPVLAATWLGLEPAEDASGASAGRQAVPPPLEAIVLQPAGGRGTRVVSCCHPGVAATRRQTFWISGTAVAVSVFLRNLIQRSPGTFDWDWVPVRGLRWTSSCLPRPRCAVGEQPQSFTSPALSLSLFPFSLYRSLSPPLPVFPTPSFSVLIFSPYPPAPPPALSHAIEEAS